MFTVYYWIDDRRTHKKAFKNTWKAALNFALDTKRGNYSYEIWEGLKRVI